MDNTDRNRTSPFAFTGNRFEFRAVELFGELRFGNDRIKCGGSLSIADFKKKVDALIASGKPKPYFRL